MNEDRKTEMTSKDATVLFSARLLMLIADAFAVGTLAGLFGHFMDHGWPKPVTVILPAEWVYPSLFLSFGVMITVGIIWFVALVLYVRDLTSAVSGDSGGSPAGSLLHSPENS